MAWKMYNVVLRLLTPLHIGHMKLGNVQRTRHYVTGKALWGALTARLTRDDPDLGGDYGTVGKRVNNELAFSYFYPATSDQVDLWPWGDAGEITWRYLNTYASTALNYSHNSAEEGSLHETEYIAPMTRDGEPVYLIGYIFENEEYKLPWREVLNRLQLGGERTYGWGRVAKVKAEPMPIDSLLFGKWKVDLNQDKPLLHGQGNELRLYAHTEWDALEANKVKGRIEPLVGRVTQAAEAHGKDPQLTAVCWMPGAQVESGVSLEIGEFGVWRKSNRGQ